MGAVLDLLEYIVYVVLIGITALLIYIRNGTKSRKRVVDEFFEYVNKGKGRHPKFSEHVLAFFLMQLLFPFFAFSVSLRIFFVVTLMIFIVYSYAMERMKKHRHNGINIGYEYPHPSHMIERTTEGTKLSKPIYAGSKGVYDLQVKSQPNPHVMIIGESGSGKSTTQETLLIRSMEKFDIPFLIIDWNGTYENMKDIANVWNVPDSLKINPLLLNGMERQRRAGMASETLQIALELTPLQTQRIRDMMTELYENNEEINMEDLFMSVENEIDNEEYKEIKLQLRYILQKLSQSMGIFGNEPKEFWKNVSSTCNIVNLSKLTDSEKTIVTLSIIQRIIEQFEGNKENGVRLNIALDDAYKAVANYNGKETLVTRVIREGRKYGFALVISTQLLNDLPNSIATNTAVKFIHTYHDPYATETIHKLMNMTELEKDILYRMPVGSCFLFDSNAIQKGKSNPAFVQIEKTSNVERRKLSGMIEKVEMKVYKAKEHAKIYNTTHVEKSANTSVQQPQHVPEVSVYRFLIAMTKCDNKEAAIRMLREKRWVSSTSTLYGNTRKPSITQRAESAGYLNRNGKLTEKAMKIVNPTLMINAQGMNAGGQLHRELMKKTIEMIQDKGNYAFVPEARNSFDVGELIPVPKVKTVWSNSNLTVYEIQTDAEKIHIDRCIKKAKTNKAKLVIVTNNQKIKEELDRQTNRGFTCIIL